MAEKVVGQSDGHACSASSRAAEAGIVTGYKDEISLGGKDLEMADNIDRRIAVRSPRTGVAVLTLAAIGLGLLMEGIILTSRLVVSGTLPEPVDLLADLLQQIAWSVLICSALTLATLLADLRWVPNAFFSVILTPVAIIGTKVLQKGINTVLALPVGIGDEHIVTLFVGRTFEYALLNILLLSLKRRGHIRFWKFLAAGLFVSAMVGIPLGLRMVDKSAPGAEQLGTMLNEVGWPTLCACFVYGTAKFRDTAATTRP